MERRSRHSRDEEAAASAVASLMQRRCVSPSPTSPSRMQTISPEWKREREESCTLDIDERPRKIIKTDPAPVNVIEKKSLSDVKPAALRPAPFFYYRDHSEEQDDDPLTPLTPPGKVPNFPAKMHAILSRPDLADVVSWMPHGRSWRVLKPREFEIRVIPTYFEHSKFSSFIRQANGWGFRRITQGRDRNSYYHELFLRGLPHLCKKMRRPGVSEKASADPDHEPDFYKISEMHHLPEKAPDDEDIRLQCTLVGGPKARMPVHLGAFSGLNSSAASFPGGQADASMARKDPPSMTEEDKPKEQPQMSTAITTQKTAQGALAPLSESHAWVHRPADAASSVQQLSQQIPTPAERQVNSVITPHSLSSPYMSYLVAAQQQQQQEATGTMANLPNTFLPSSSAAALAAAAAAGKKAPYARNQSISQFAAGFAAATALSNSQVRQTVHQVLAAMAAASSSQFGGLQPNTALLQALLGATAPGSAPQQQQQQQQQHPCQPTFFSGNPPNSPGMR